LFQLTKNKSNKAQLIWGLLIGIVFGFLLQKGGATKYDVIVGQLLLIDHTVLKIMLSAVLTGMLGLYALKARGLIELSLKSGSIGMNVIGGLIFGVGFAILGYCPGTIAGAIGNGYLDALTGGLPGILIGSGLFAAIYPKVKDGVLKAGYYGDITLPRLLKAKDWVVVIPVGILIILILFLLEGSGVM